MKNDRWGEHGREATQIDRHVGQRIKLRRRTLNLTQLDLAGALRIDTNEVSMLEAGVRRASAGTLYILCNFMGVSPEWFFKGFGEAASKPSHSDQPEIAPPPCEELISLVKAADNVELCREVLRFARLLVQRSRDNQAPPSSREIEC